LKTWESFLGIDLAQTALGRKERKKKIINPGGGKRPKGRPQKNNRTRKGTGGGGGGVGGQRTHRMWGHSRESPREKGGGKPNTCHLTVVKKRGPKTRVNKLAEDNTKGNLPGCDTREGKEEKRISPPMLEVVATMRETERCFWREWWKKNKTHRGNNTGTENPFAICVGHRKSLKKRTVMTGPIQNGRG